MKVAAKFVSSTSSRCIRRSILTNRVKSMSTLSTDGDYLQFPREHEGNIYDDNWSVAVDGVITAANLYRNARIPVLTQRLSAKVESGKVSLEKPKYDGAYVALEAGDGIQHEDFADRLAEQQAHLSTGIDLFVEDAIMGSFAASRVGVRVITDSPAAALIARTLLIQGPPRRTDHRARFNGWNFDDRWMVNQSIWNGTSYDFVSEPTVSLDGERPIVVYHGGPGDLVALQFVERKEVLVGANVVVGGAAPIRGLIAAIGQASSVMINTMYSDCIAIPSVSIRKGKDTTVIVGADDSVVDAASAKNVLYGAYDNVISTVGVSAMWSGVIHTSGAGDTVPTVVVQGKSATPLAPDNLAFPAKHIVFYEKGAKSKSLTEDEAVQRLVDLSDETRKEVAAAIVKGVKLSLTGSAEEAVKI